MFTGLNFELSTRRLEFVPTVAAVDIDNITEFELVSKSCKLVVCLQTKSTASPVMSAGHIHNWIFPSWPRPFADATSKELTAESGGKFSQQTNSCRI
jgi:hypothetical protein